MSINTAFKTRIHLNNKQKSRFKHWCNAKRYAYNWALHLCFLENDTNEKFNLSRINDFDKYFNAGKYPLRFEKKHKSGFLIGTGTHEWLKEIPSSVCQLAIKYDLKNAWKRFFKKLSEGKPKFHGRHVRRSFKLSNADLKKDKISTAGYLQLPKGLGSAKLADLPKWWSGCRLLGTTFSEEGGKWFVSFTVKCPEEDYYRYYPNRASAVGVDLGIRKMAALSNGELVELDREQLKHLQNRIEHLQRRLTRHKVKALKVIVKRCEQCSIKNIQGLNDIRRLCRECRNQFNKKPGKNNKGVRLQSAINRAKNKQVMIRINAAHQLTASLTKRFETVVIEDLRIKNMTASAKGNQEKPGKNIRQKAGLNREWLNVAPYRIRSQLDYKTERTGGRLIAVDPKNTSRQCSHCGFTHKDNRKNEQFVCGQCGFVMDADLQAAINIEKKGILNLNNS